MEVNNTHDQIITNQPSSEKPGERQHWVLFWLSMLSGLSMSCSVFLEFFGAGNQASDNEQARVYAGILVMNIVPCIVFIINSCVLCVSVGEMCELFWMLDNSFLVLVVALVAMNGVSYLAFMLTNGVTIFMTIVLSITMFLFLGNFRVMMYHCKWVKWRVISAKIILILCACVYISVAMVFMVTQAQNFRDGYFTTTDINRIKDFIFYYVFAMFAVVLEVFGRISHLDGTGELNYYYSFDSEVSEQIELQQIKQ